MIEALKTYLANVDATVTTNQKENYPQSSDSNLLGVEMEVADIDVNTFGWMGVGSDGYYAIWGHAAERKWQKREACVTLLLNTFEWPKDASPLYFFPTSDRTTPRASDDPVWHCASRDCFRTVGCIAAKHKHSCVRFCVFDDSDLAVAELQLDNGAEGRFSNDSTVDPADQKLNQATQEYNFGQIWIELEEQKYRDIERDRDIDHLNARTSQLDRLVDTSTDLIHRLTAQVAALQSELGRLGLRPSDSKVR
jgi:hypothetical protein